MEFLVFLTLLVIGYLFGRLAEQRHFTSIRAREAEFRDVLAFSARFPPPTSKRTDAVLVDGNVVVAVDYFKMTAAALRNLLGGRVTSFETLIERARREAILRMKANARARGATQIFNVKLETSSIGQGASGQSFSVEVYAYGTALIPVTAS